MKLAPIEGRTIVALSGGADSVALLRLLVDAGSSVVALHCNFHLRGEESDRDEQFVRTLCDKLSVELHVKHFETREYAQSHGVSIEMAARDLRYAWFEEMRTALGCDQIAVAHHRDDQAETVLLNLLRGTGLKGLAGMHRRNGSVVRPLLDYSRQDLLGYLDGIGQDFVTDSTNLERDALRNRIRLDVMPLLKEINPRAVEHIAQTAERVESALEHSHEEYSLHAIHEWLHPYGFTSAQQEAIYRELDGPTGAIYESATHRLLRDRGRLILSDKAETKDCQLEFSIHETDNPLQWLKQQNLSGNCAYLDADKLSLPLTKRHPENGDRFHPFGMKGSRLVSDFLTDLKLNRFEKEQQWLLLNGNDIVWVVGRRTDNRYRVTEGTRRIYCILSKMP